MHVTLALSTGLLRNLNHIYAAQDGESWAGLWIFAASMVVVIVGWVAATPLTLRHPRLVQRVGFALIGPVQRLFEHVDATPGEYSEKDISPYFWHNGQYPDSVEYTALFEGDFADYRLRIDGLVDNPVELDLAQLRTAPPRADHPALLHPGVVGHRQVGLLLPRRRPGQGHLLRRAPHRADGLPPDHAGLRHER
jgi:hypothetical protein